MDYTDYISNYLSHPNSALENRFEAQRKELMSFGETMKKQAQAAAPPDYRPTLSPQNLTWTGICYSLMNGNITIEEVQKKYRMDDHVRDSLYRMMNLPVPSADDAGGLYTKDRLRRELEQIREYMQPPVIRLGASDLKSSTLNKHETKVHGADQCISSSKGTKGIRSGKQAWKTTNRVGHLGNIVRVGRSKGKVVQGKIGSAIQL